MNELSIVLDTEDDTEALGRNIANLISAPMTIFLLGDLGTGKTRLSRAILHGLGHEGVVKSPTYTLVEPYEFTDFTVFHFDLYRLADPSELDFMGIRDYFTEQAIVLVEWPERGAGYLNPEDLTIQLNYRDTARDCSIRAQSESGNILLEQLKQNL